MITELPNTIQWAGKRATLIVWRVRAGQWSADYYYKKWPSKHGGWNMNLAVGRLGRTEQEVYNKLLRWYREEGHKAQPKVREAKRKATINKSHGTNKLF